MSNAILKGNASGTGSVTLESPNTNSDRTISLPDANGTAMVSGNMPAFSAYKSGTDQTVTTLTFTKITFETEKFDTNNNFASSRFTPTVAGYYQINSVLRYSGTAINDVTLELYKNGTSYERGQETGLLSASNTSGQILLSTIIYLNGSSDYVEIYGYIDGAGTLKFTQANSVTTCLFSGCLVRSA